MPTRPFDEVIYPRLNFSRQQLDVIALAREVRPDPLRTKTVAQHFGWSLLPDGRQVTSPTRYSVACATDSLYLQPVEQWGRQPGEIQSRFRPKGGPR